MFDSHIGIWPTVTLFRTLPAASDTDNYQRLIYRGQQGRKWSEWLPTELRIGFVCSMFVLAAGMRGDAGVMLKKSIQLKNWQQMNYSKESAIFKSTSSQLDNLGLKTLIVHLVWKPWPRHLTSLRFNSWCAMLRNSQICFKLWGINKICTWRIFSLESGT